MKRRAVLSVSVGIAVSGCLGWATRAPKRIGVIRLVNERSEPYTIDVVIERDGEEAFSQEYQLGTTQDASTVSIDTPLQEAGRPVIRFRVDDQWVSMYPEEYERVEGHCIDVHFQLHRGGTIGYDADPSTKC
jgi:hypothetical protein